MQQPSQHFCRIIKQPMNESFMHAHREEDARRRERANRQKLYANEGSGLWKLLRVNDYQIAEKADPRCKSVMQVHAKSHVQPGSGANGQKLYARPKHHHPRSVALRHDQLRLAAKTWFAYAHFKSQSSTYTQPSFHSFLSFQRRPIFTPQCRAFRSPNGHFYQTSQQT